jgi:anti-sigma factor RsiW
VNANQSLSDADLSAYADGQLAPDRTASVEAVIARDPALAARVAEIRAQNAALTAALDPWLAEPIPERLIAAAAPPVRQRGAWKPALAAAATLVLGLAVGWFARDAILEQQGTPTTFAREAAFTHVLYTADQRRPVEVWASEEKGLVTWLTKRLGHPVHAPDLNPLGYGLVGGRLVSGNERPTGLFMYENAEKQRLTLQVRKLDPSARETAFRYAVENGVGVFYWIDDGCAYAISGNVDRAQLLAVARTGYGHLASADVAPASR